VSLSHHLVPPRLKAALPASPSFTAQTADSMFLIRCPSLSVRARLMLSLHPVMQFSVQL
ncbi:hypothetical protein KUCAC02_036074, partial [Chaenocephalus aceratus]